MPAMPALDALRTLIDRLGPEWLVVTNQGSARLWPKLCRRPQDLHYNPSTMGGVVPLALGLALAQPARHVLAVTGDGALLMSLGSLVTAAAGEAPNLTVIVLDNGLYEVTGGQRTPAAFAAVDYAGLARAAGFPTARDFAELAAWQAGVDEFLRQPGPRFARLAVAPAAAEDLKFPTPPIAGQLADVRAALGLPPLAFFADEGGAA